MIGTVLVVSATSPLAARAASAAQPSSPADAATSATSAPPPASSTPGTTSPASGAPVATSEGARVVPATAGYDLDRGAFIRTRDGAWELNPYAMVQVRYGELFRDGRFAEQGFSLRSVKLILRGHVLSPKITAHVQVDGGEGRFVAEDVYLRWDALAELGVLAGQIEVPFNRQHITLEAYQELVDRSIVDARFSLRRDLGVAAYAHDPAQRFEATAGVWNGSGQDAPNDNQTLMPTLRLAFNPWGPIPFREGDVADSPRPLLSVAAAGAYNPARVDVIDGGTAVFHHIAQAVGEATLRYHGLSVTSEAHVRRRVRQGGGVLVDEGAFGQVGYFVWPHRLDIAARLAGIAGDLAPADPIRELAGVVGLYLNGHRFKLQAEYRWVTLHGGTNEHGVLSQLQFFL